MDTLQKKRVLKDGTVLDRVYGEGVPNYRGSTQEVEEAINGINNQEGCQIIGYLNLKKVPGNFHISYHAKMDVLNKIASTNPEAFAKMNLNFKINHLGFGENTAQIANI